MLIHKIQAVVIVLLLALSATAYSDGIEAGGKCEFIDEQLLTRVASVNNGVVELEPMYGDIIRLSNQEFDLPVNVNDYYELFIRRHTSGGCSPYSISHKVKVAISNVVLSLTEQQAYAASFILDEAKNCAYAQLADGCQADLALDDSFQRSQLPLLSHIKPRSVGTCSVAMMTTILQQIEPAEKQTRLISCIERLDGEELAVEFSLSDGGAKLLLNKVY